MRVLFTALGGRPHLYPLVPLAWAFRAAGHEVRFATAPRLIDDVVHIGLPAVAVGGSPNVTRAERDDLVAAMYDQDPWPPGFAGDLGLLDDAQLALLHRLGRYQVAASDSIADDLVAFARHWRPDLVCYDAATCAGAVTTAVLGVPGVRHQFGSDSYPRLELRAPTDQPLPEYVKLFERFGVPVSTTEAVIVEPTPPSMRLAEESPRLDMRYLPFNGPGSVPAWLPDWLRGSAGRPRVCVTWGYTGPGSLGAAAADPYRGAIEALSALDASVLVLTTAEQLEQLGALPDRAVGAGWVPLQLVVGHCDLLVHQGGDGTTLTGACFAVPQLAITAKPDAETAAARIAANHAGIHLPYQRLRGDPASQETIKAAAGELLTDPAYRDAARTLRAEIHRQPPPAEIVGALAGLAT
jgi:UDP:flavonoid glycosyltransferase YjiC (YdhE family)